MMENVEDVTENKVSTVCPLCAHCVPIEKCKLEQLFGKQSSSLKK